MTVKRQLPAWMVESFHRDADRAKVKTARWQASMLRVYADLAETQTGYRVRRWLPLWCLRILYRWRRRNYRMIRTRRYPHGATVTMRKAADTIEYLLAREP